MVCCAKIITDPSRWSAALLDRQSIKQQVKWLQDCFVRLAYCTYKELVAKHINVHDVHAWLISLDVFRQREHQEFIKDHLTNIEKDTHLNNLWARLGTYWNFLNFDLLEHLVSGFGSEDLKQNMESYKCDLQFFRKATRICDFINCWPERVEPPPERELREFVAKVGYHWEKCTLEDLDMIEGVITRRFFLPRFVLQLREIKPGSITVTWLIPASFVKALQEAIESTSSEFFTEQTIEIITVDGQECYPTHTRNPVEYSEKQLTSGSVAKPEPEIQQREDPSVGAVSKKLHSFKSRASEERASQKETHRMRLAEEILSGESTSTVPSEKIQFDTQPDETMRETESSSFLSKLKRIQQQTIPSKQPSIYQRMPYTSDSPTLDEMEALSEEFPKPHIHTKPISSYSSSYSSRDPGGSLFDSPRLDEMEELSLMPKPHTHLGGTIPRTGYRSSRVSSSFYIPTKKLKPKPHTQLGGTKPRFGYSSSTSEDWFEQAEIDVRKGTPAERYVREKCVDEISRHVKLLPSPEQYLSKTEVEADPSLPTKYKDYLFSTPAIRAALYTTFNAKTSAEVFTWSLHTESPPPATMTELFTAVTLKTLVDHLLTHPVYHKQQLKVTTFSDLPSDVYKQFQDLCRMAYEGILNRQQLVFSAAHLPIGFSPLGLMQEVPQLYTEGRASSYHFIHLTLQEYLAAVHISQLPAHEQTRLFQEHVNSGHFKMTMRFLAGHTKLANIPPDITMDDDTKLNYFHFLFEANNISMTTRPLGSDQMDVWSCYSWTPLDYYVTGHAISHSNCPWRLEFSSSSIDDDKFELFCQGCAAPGGTGCRGHISIANFGFNDLTYKSIQSFVNIPPHILRNMRELWLSFNKLDGSACDLLAKAIPSMSRLQKLRLDGNPIGSGGAVEVIKALCGSGVKKLWLYNTGIREPDCEALCELLKSSHSLQDLYIHRNNLSSESVASIITGLSHNSSLTTLIISNSHFSKTNVDSLASILKDHSKCTLTELWLQDCHISSEGAVELAAALCKNTTLEHLNLSDNPIGEHVEGVTAVANMLVENKTLTELNLRDCHISSEGAVELADALCKNSTLKRLYLDGNPIGVEGASSMSDMLQHNTSLEELWLRDDSVGEEGVRQLINSLKHNQTLRQLWLREKYKSETSDHRIHWW